MVRFASALLGALTLAVSACGSVSESPVVAPPAPSPAPPPAAAGWEEAFVAGEALGARPLREVVVDAEDVAHLTEFIPDIKHICG